MTLSLLILLRVVLKNVAVAVVAALTIAPPILHMQPGAGQETMAGRARGQVAILCAAARRKTSRLKRVGGAHRRRRTVTRGGGWSSSATRRCWGHGGSLAAVSSERIQHRTSRCFLVLSLGVPRCVHLFCLLCHCCIHLARGLAPSLPPDAVGRSSLATWQ